MAFDFPSAPTVGQVYNGYVWDGEKWQVQGSAASGAVRYDIAQGLNAAQQSQARANIAVTRKNYIINGAMQISQENGTTPGNASPTGFYPADQFAVTNNATTGVVSATWVASHTPGGSDNRIRITVTTADATVAAADLLWVVQLMEGFRCVDLNFGKASAKTVTLQFGVKAPAGTYCAILLNGAANRSYVAEYVISAGEANIDVTKSVTIPGDTVGTWDYGATTGLQVRWGLMAGTTYQQTAGAWGTTSAVGSPNQFNFMGTVGNVFELFDVSLTEGTVAPPFVVPDYASELAACQRYFRPLDFNGAMVAISAASVTVNSSYNMRATPTVTAVNALGVYSNGADRVQSAPHCVTAGTNSPVAGAFSCANFTSLLAGPVIRSGNFNFNVANLNARL